MTESVVDVFCPSEISVDSGLPQMSVLRPILFLPQQVKSHCRLFADGCLLCREISYLQDSIALQQVLTSIEGWSDTWGLYCNHARMLGVQPEVSCYHRK